MIRCIHHKQVGQAFGITAPTEFRAKQDRTRIQAVGTPPLRRCRPIGHRRRSPTWLCGTPPRDPQTPPRHPPIAAEDRRLSHRGRACTRQQGQNCRHAENIGGCTVIFIVHSSTFSLYLPLCLSPSLALFQFNSIQFQRVLLA